MSDSCYCDSGKSFQECCEPFLFGKKEAASALELMRSRYSAYVLKKGKYLFDTCSQALQNPEEIEAINTQSIQWLGLKVQSFSENEVTFMAYYRENTQIHVMKERSYFIIEGQKYKYDHGTILEAQIGRNESCPCGSGKKFKKCCGK